MENTLYRIAPKYDGKDHLHLRGEYFKGALKMKKIIGSSPLTWRILLNEKFGHLEAGIISTYVENTNRETW